MQGTPLLAAATRPPSPSVARATSSVPAVR